MNPLLFYEYGLSKPAGLPFISTWKTDNVSAGSSTASQVKLPLISTGTYAFNVDWGDGLSNYITSYNQAQTTHTYASSGTYTITITGTCKGWQFNNVGDILKILSVNSWGGLKLGTTQGGYFWGCGNLNLSSVSDVLDLTGTISLYAAFYKCTSLTTINKIDEWNTTSVTNMEIMFGNTNFNQNIGAWNVSNVTSFRSMFSSMSFNNGGTSDINNWIINTNASVNMVLMFAFNPNFNQPLNSWNTSAVTDMQAMFTHATNFNQNIGGWNVNNVKSFKFMFEFAEAFNNGGSPDINNWSLNTSVAPDLNSMFQFATNFNQPINNWNTSAVTAMNSMFYKAINFNQPLNNWNTSAVKEMGGMFRQATLFNQPLNNWDVSAVTIMAFMFSETNFNQPLNNWNTSAVTNMSYMFYLATKFNQDLNSWNVSNVTNFGGFMYGKLSSNFSTSNLDAIYNGWSSRTVKPGITITFGSAKRTSASDAGKAILIGSPNNWLITDGGI
jgi:surface protein